MHFVINTHHRWKSSELYSVGNRYYYEYNGMLFKINKKDFKKVLTKVEDMNPLECAKYLIEQAASNNQFKKMYK